MDMGSDKNPKFRIERQKICSFFSTFLQDFSAAKTAKFSKEAFIEITQKPIYTDETPDKKKSQTQNVFSE